MAAEHLTVVPGGPPDPDDEDLWSVERTARFLGMSVHWIYKAAERGDLPHERERRLRRSNRDDLPPCITRYREALEPGLTVGTAVTIVPGVSCVDGCVFELCPYPPKGGLPRVELSEAFCRRQLILLKRSLRHPLTRQAPWQQMTPGQLRGFWTGMADRARGPRPQTPRTGPTRARRLRRRRRQPAVRSGGA